METWGNVKDLKITKNHREFIFKKERCISEGFELKMLMKVGDRLINVDRNGYDRGIAIVSRILKEFY